MLGPVQKAQFKTDLLASTATHKYVINEVPIQEFYVLPYDRWETYAAEREELLNFIRDNAIENVVFLTTDTHANLSSEVAIDRYTDPEPIAREIIAGPIATNTFFSEVFSFGGAFAVDAVNRALDIPWKQCRHGDAYAYGLVEVDSTTGSTTVTLKDETATLLVNQVVPADTCVWTSPGAPSIRVMDPDLTNDGTVRSADISAVVMCYGMDSNVECDLDATNAVRSADIVLTVMNYGLKWPPLNMPETPMRPLTFYVRASDPDNDAITITADGLPAGATFTDPGPPKQGKRMKFEWTPSSTQGPTYYRVAFKVSDGTLVDTDGLGIDVDNTVP
jgi:hypothetical protein